MNMNSDNLEVAARIIDGTKAYFIVGGCVCYLLVRFMLPLVEARNMQSLNRSTSLNEGEQDRASLLAQTRPPRGRHDSTAARQAAPPTAA